MMDRLKQDVHPRLHLVRDPHLELPPPARATRIRAWVKTGVVVAIACAATAGLTWAVLGVFG